MNRVTEYYNQCHTDYQWIWGVKRNLGFHYGFYDDGIKDHDRAIVRMNEVLADRARITKTDKVLDAGCGIGGSVIWLAKNIGCCAVGININENQLRIAKDLARRNNVDGLVEFLVKDFTDTGLADGSFDVVWALESACHAERKADFAQEAYRLLAVGGRIVVSDGFLAEGLSKDQKTAVKQWTEGWTVPNLATVSEFTTILGRSGFANIVSEDVTRYILPSSVRLHMAAITLFPIGKIMESLGLRSKVQTANIISAREQYNTLAKGYWKYCIFTARR